jgi:hypothetical protein
MTIMAEMTYYQVLKRFQFLAKLRLAARCMP